MPVTLNFLADMPTGLQAEAYDVLDFLGGSILAGPIDTATVAPDQSLTFPNTNATAGAASLAFCVIGGDGTPIWRSGPIDATADNQFYILNPSDLAAAAGKALQFPPSAFQSLSPQLPFTTPDGSTTIRSISSITPGNGTISIAGAGVHSGVAVKFTYTFSLQPASQHPDATHVVDVETQSMDVQADNGTWFGWLINFFVGAFLDLFPPSAGPVQSAIQNLINNAVQNAVSAKGPVPGTTAAVQQLSVDPTNGILLQAFAGVPAGSLCSGTASSGSVKIRPAAEIDHLRAIRDKMLIRSPEGSAYAAFLRDNNRDLMRLLVAHPDLLKAADAVVASVLAEFGADAPEQGVLSAATAAMVSDLFARFAAVAPRPLAVAIAGLRGEVAKFVGKAAGPVLQASWGFVTGVAVEVPPVRLPLPPTHAPLP